MWGRRDAEAARATLNGACICGCTISASRYHRYRFDASRSPDAMTRQTECDPFTYNGEDARGHSDEPQGGAIPRLPHDVCNSVEATIADLDLLCREKGWDPSVPYLFASSYFAADRRWSSTPAPPSGRLAVYEPLWVNPFRKKLSEINIAVGANTAKNIGLELLKCIRDHARLYGDNLVGQQPDIDAAQLLWIEHVLAAVSQEEE